MSCNHVSLWHFISYFFRSDQPRVSVSVNMQLTKSHSSSCTAGVWDDGSCSVVCPVPPVKSLLFSRRPHSQPNIALFLTCKMKGNRGQYGQGNESFLIPLARSHSTGFLLYHGYAQGRQELALFLALSQALGTYFPAVWKLTGSLSPFCSGGSNGDIPRCHFTARSGSDIPMKHRHQAPLSGTTHSQRGACRLHCYVCGLLHGAASKFAGIFLYPPLERILIIW